MPLSDFLEKLNPLEKPSSAGELYLCLVISDKKVKSGIWAPKSEKSQENVEILSFGSTENWGGESAEELIVVADTSIATAVSKLPEISGSQPTKTVLGLPESWIEDNSIKHDKLVMLEKVSKKLLLKPQGFLVTAEAISHLLKKNEGGLPSVILASLEEPEVAVSLIVGGKFLGTKLVGRSENLALDLEEGLLRFDYRDNLPSRILLFDGNENLEEAKQSLISYPWVGPEGEKKLHFLQLPKVETASENFEISSVIFASCHEFNPKIETKIVTEVKEQPEVLKDEAEEQTVVKNEGLAEENFGFVKNTDVAKGQSVEPIETAKIAETALELSTVVENEENFPKAIAKPKLISVFTSFLSIFKHFRIKLPSVSLSFFSRKAFAVIFVILLLVGLTSAGVLTLVKDEVKIFVRPQKIEKTFDFSVIPNISLVDAEKMAIPAREVAQEVSGEKTADVNGKKTVGDKATGEVTIYNRTEQLKTVPKGTVIKGPSSTKFVLNSEVKVSSKSADLEKGVDQWGEVKAQVTAFDIGAQYNLEANSSLSFENISTSTLLVKNSSAFSGGTSREIQAVSKEDRDGLQKSLAQELEDKASKEIAGKIGDQDKLLPDSIKLKSETDTFNHSLNDEASTLTLQEKAQFSAYYLKQEDFAVLVDKTISPLIATGYEKDPVKEDKTFNSKDKVKGLYTANVSQENLPVVDQEKIKKDLRLKTFSQAEEYIRKNDQVAGVQITVSPHFLSRIINIMPYFEKNITVLVEPM